MSIIPFSTKLAKHFKSLNIEWLEKNFKVEPQDAAYLDKPQKNIINKGGYVFFYKLDNDIVGTLAFIKQDDNDFELSKMAVTKSVQNKGIANKLLEFSLEYGKAKHWKTLIIYSNTQLEAAIYLYKKYGFKEIALEDNCPYQRANIKLQLDL